MPGALRQQHSQQGWVLLHEGTAHVLRLRGEGKAVAGLPGGACSPGHSGKQPAPTEGTQKHRGRGLHRGVCAGGTLRQPQLQNPVLQHPFLRHGCYAHLYQQLQQHLEAQPHLQAGGP